MCCICGGTKRENNTRKIRTGTHTHSLQVLIRRNKIINKHIFLEMFLRNKIINKHIFLEMFLRNKIINKHIFLEMFLRNKIINKHIFLEMFLRNKIINKHIFLEMFLRNGVKYISLDYWYKLLTVCNICICRPIRNTDDSRCSGTKRLLTSSLLIFRHKERETQFLLCWLYYLTQQTRCASRSPQAELARPRVGSQLTSFLKSPKISAHRIQAWRHSHPVPFPTWGFYNDIYDCHILCARAWTELNVCTCACTKPNSSKSNQTE